MKLSRQNSFKRINQLKHIITKKKNYYSQHGEDVIMCNYFKTRGRNNIFYVDIGSGDPILHSNTYLLYTKGSRGVCVDANNRLLKKYRFKRKRDITLCYAVTGRDSSIEDLYVFDMHTVSTLEKENVEYLVDNGFKVKRIDKVNTININAILDIASQIQKIDLLSVDIEGDEITIIKSIDYVKYNPEIICVEVVDFETGMNLPYSTKIIEFLQHKGYILIANTDVNLIFAKQQ